MVQILAGARDFSLLQNVHTSSGVHPASSSVGSRVLSKGKNSQGMKLTTHLYLVLMLRISGAILLLPMLAFMVWTGTTLHFTEALHIIL
jgi:hypothetical protein